MDKPIIPPPIIVVLKSYLATNELPKNYSKESKLIIISEGSDNWLCCVYNSQSKYYRSTDTQDYERTDFDLMYNLRVFFATRYKIKHYD